MQHIGTNIYYILSYIHTLYLFTFSNKHPIRNLQFMIVDVYITPTQYIIMDIENKRESNIHYNVMVFVSRKCSCIIYWEHL